MPVRRVKELLEGEGVPYRVIEHPTAYTAQEEAAAAHVPGRSWAKTVVFFADRRPGLAVLPATHHVDPERLAQASGAEKVRLATEEECGELFPECELGAMPPFGGLWGIPVYVDRSLGEASHVAFHAGSHREAVELAYSDFERVSGAAVAEFAEPGTPKKGADAF